MNVKKMVFGLLVVMGLVGILSGNGFAAEAWYTCTIDRIGGNTPVDGMMYVQLTDTASPKKFTKMYFRIPEGRLNQTMAALLTAASNGATVYVKADHTIATQSQRLLKVVYYNAQ
jgi:hypothetical protein